MLCTVRAELLPRARELFTKAHAIRYSGQPSFSFLKQERPAESNCAMKAEDPDYVDYMYEIECKSLYGVIMALMWRN